MQLKIDAAGPTKKTAAFKPYFGIKCGNDWYNVEGERDPDLIGKTVEAEVRDSGKFKWAKIKQESKPSIQKDDKPAGGRKHLNQFEMGEAVDFWWEKIKPFEMADDAKASVLCTLLIATADGRVEWEFPPEPPIDDDEDPFK